MWGTESINIVCSEGEDRAGLERAVSDFVLSKRCNGSTKIFHKNFQRKTHKI